MRIVDRKEEKVTGERIGDAIAIGFFLIMAFTTLAFGGLDPWAIAVLSLSTTVLFLCWGIKCFIDKRLSFNVPMTALPIIGIFLYTVLQSLSFTDSAGKRWSISMDVESTRMALEVVGCLILAFLLGASVFNNRHRIAWLRNFLIFFGLSLAIFGLIQHFTWNGRMYWVVDATVPNGTPFGPFVNRNHFAGYIEMIVPIPVALILTRAVKGETSLLYGFAAVLMAIATVTSLSRAGMISLVSGLMFVVVIGLRPSMLRDEPSIGFFNRLRVPLFLSRIGASAVIIISILAGVWWFSADSVINRVERTELSTRARGSAPGKETVYQSRGWIWHDTMMMIRDNWLTGVGLGAFPTVYPIYNERDGSLIVRQAHNDYLQAIADCGVLGIAAAVLFIYLVFRDILKATRHRDPMMASMAIGCGGGIFALLVHSMFDFNLQLPSNALLFLVLTAVVAEIGLAALKSRVKDTSYERSPRLRGVSRELEVLS